MIPKRFKTIEELSIAEMLERDRARRRGVEWEAPERDEYVKARRRVLREAGFTDEADESTSLGDMNPEQHARRQGR